MREQLAVLQCAQQLLAPEAVGMPRWSWKLAWGQHWLPLGIEVPPPEPNSQIESSFLERVFLYVSVYASCCFPECCSCHPASLSLIVNVVLECLQISRYMIKTGKMLHVGAVLE